MTRFHVLAVLNQESQAAWHRQVFEALEEGKMDSATRAQDVRRLAGEEGRYALGIVDEPWA